MLVDICHPSLKVLTATNETMASDVEAPRLEEQLLPEQQEVRLLVLNISDTSVDHPWCSALVSSSRLNWLMCCQDGTECAGTA